MFIILQLHAYFIVISTRSLSLVLAVILIVICFDNVAR